MVSSKVLGKDDEAPRIDEPGRVEPGVANYASCARLPSPGHMDDVEVPVRYMRIPNRSRGTQVAIRSFNALASIARQVGGVDQALALLLGNPEA